MSIAIDEEINSKKIQIPILRLGFGFFFALFY